MLCREIMEILEKTYPCGYALDWDNVGLLVGRDDREVKRLYIALDADDDAVDAAVRLGADMLVTHHPLLFSGLKRITNRDFTGARILKLIRHDISCYAMHTNYDVAGMAELSARILGLSGGEALEVTREGAEGEPPEGIGRVADLKEPVPLDKICSLVKDRFHLEHVKVFGDGGGLIRRVAISPGSGKSMVKAALEQGADVLITGDIDHHTGIDAVAQHLAVIDAGHYGIEHIFIADVKEYLEGKLPDVEICAAPIRHPFRIV